MFFHSGLMAFLCIRNMAGFASKWITNRFETFGAVRPCRAWRMVSVVF